MVTKKISYLFLIIFIVIVLNPAESLAKKSSSSKNTVIYIPEKQLPRHVFVLPPLPAKGVKINKTFSKILRSTIQNYLSGKGYIIKYGDKIPNWAKNLSLKNFNPKEVSKKLQDTDGFFLIIIHQFSGTNIVLFKRYKIDAELCLFNKKGEKLACWREDVSRRKLDLATDPLGIALKVVGGVLSESSEAKMKVLVYDWAYQISVLVPGFSSALRKPKILRVLSNIEKDKIFKIGDKIIVAIEGDPGLEASFDIGTFKKNIKAIETNRPGIYKGFYLVQKGDETKAQYLLVRLKNPQGEVREWLELEPLINIDGVPPAPPVNLSYKVEEKCVKINWNCKDTSTKGFIVFRSEKPLSGYQEIARVRDIKYTDTHVEPGKKYYYRIAAFDKAGNLSEKVQIGPIEIPVVGLVLKGNLPEKLGKGSYQIKDIVKIPCGQATEIGPEATLVFSPGTKLVVEGRAVVKNSSFESQKDLWKGIEIKEKGSFEAENTKIVGANTALSVKGQAKLIETTLYHGEKGIVLKGLSNVSIKKSKIYGFKQGIIVENGEISVKESTLKDNNVGIIVKNGDINLTNVNFLDNKINIKSFTNIVLQKCYLGKDYTDFRLEGPITVVSYLSLPYPEGKEVTFDPEVLKKKAKELLEEGKKFIKEENYGKACQCLEKAYKISKDEEIYYWLVYVYTMLEEEQKLAKIIEEALEKFPYEVKIYQLAVRYYLFKGQINEAEKIVDRALKLQPNNPSLEALKSLIEIQKNAKNKEGNSTS